MALEAGWSTDTLGIHSVTGQWEEGYEKKTNYDVLSANQNFKVAGWSGVRGR